MSAPPLEQSARGAKERNLAARALVTAITLLLRAVAASVALAWTSSLWAGSSSTFLTMLLAAVPAFLALLVIAALERVGPALGLRPAGLARTLPPVGIGLALTLAGFYASNVLLIDAALQPRTLVGYCLASFLGIALGYVTYRRLGRRHALLALLGAHAEQVLTAGCLIAAVGLLAADAEFLSDGYPKFHFVAGFAALLFFAAFSRLALPPNPRRLAVAALALGVLIAASYLGASGVSASVGYSRMLDSRSIQQRLLLIARRLSDRDGDGFAAHFGGGDCDDANPRAYPLAPGSSDCLGWRGVGSAVPFREKIPRAAPATRAPDPHVIVLLTIDAFRCGFGAEERPEFRDICPNLTRLGHEGKLRPDAHTCFPSTANAIASLHTGDPAFGLHPRRQPEFLLARWMREQGRNTHAIATHPYVMRGPQHDSFETVDTSLKAVAMGPSGVTSDAVSDKVEAFVRTNTAPAAAPAFVWAHYYDPHAPYAAEAGSAWAIPSDLERYVAEIRRTDAAVGRLLDSFRDLPRSVFVLITADHGEEFGERGAFHHGSTLNEAALRVPILVWSNRSNLVSERVAALPGTTADIASLLVAVAAARPFEPSQQAFAFASSDVERAFALYEGPWKLVRRDTFAMTELYDLATDRAGMRDLSASRAAEVRKLGQAMAAFLGEPAAR